MIVAHSLSGKPAIPVPIAGKDILLNLFSEPLFKLFFIESGLLGMVGGIIGILIGLAMAYGLAAAGRAALGADLIQAHVSVWLIIGSLAFSFGVGLLSGLTPALQAAKKHPVDALRYAK